MHAQASPGRAPAQMTPALSPQVVWLDGLTQAVVAYARDMREGEWIPRHCHARAQLLYASSGVMAVSTPGQAFIVPPSRAVWVPGGVPHEVQARTALTMRTLYVRAQAVPENRLSAPCAVAVTALLRELILAALDGPQSYPPETPRARLSAVILDRLAALSPAPLALPVPGDRRLTPIVEALMADPGERRRLDEWATHLGLSERTLSRRFQAGTGMTFRAWRQQCCLMHALERLGRGQSVTRVALDLGYDSPSAFIAMFRRALGNTPAAYLREAQASGRG